MAKLNKTLLALRFQEITDCSETKAQEKRSNVISEKVDKEILEKKHMGKKVDMRGTNEDIVNVPKETKHEEKEHMPISENPTNKKDFRM